MLPHVAVTPGTSHAVVVGASMAGLTTAAALTRRFRRVTVVDRDRLPRGVAHRKGVPQGRHLHLLLPAGAAALEQLLPGVLAEAAASGATGGDTDRIRLCLNGHRLASARTGHTAVFSDRPVLEAHVRDRVRAHPSVTFAEGRTLQGYVSSADRRHITGVRLRDALRHRHGEGHGDEAVPADLVVDCSGRGSPTPARLQELGFDPPRSDELRVDVRYMTCPLVLSSDALGGDRHVLIGPTTDAPRGAAMTHVGPDRWLVTLFAMHGEAVPRAPDDLLRFADALPIPDIRDALSAAEVVGEPSGFRFRANVRHRYERSSSLPHGLLVAGDAVCSFNPIYGQGMSVAALEAVTLNRLLRDGGVPAPIDWFRSITPVVDAAWELAAGSDAGMPRPGGRPTWRARAGDGYLQRLHAAAAADPVLTERFVRVAGLLDPPRVLLSPRSVLRVASAPLTARVRRRLPLRPGRAVRKARPGRTLPPDRATPGGHAMSEKPTPTDEELDGQPAPETQPDADLPDLTPQARADDEQERRGSTAPGQEPDQQRDQEAGQAPGRQADQEPGQQDGREPGRS